VDDEANKTLLLLLILWSRSDVIRRCTSASAAVSAQIDAAIEFAGGIAAAVHDGGQILRPLSVAHLCNAEILIVRDSPRLQGIAFRLTLHNFRLKTLKKSDQFRFGFNCTC